MFSFPYPPPIAFSNWLRNTTAVFPILRNATDKDWYVPEWAWVTTITNTTGTLPGYNRSDTGNVDYYECELPIIYGAALMVEGLGRGGGDITDVDSLQLYLQNLFTLITAKTGDLIPVSQSFKELDISITGDAERTVFTIGGNVPSGDYRVEDVTRSQGVRTICIPSNHVLFGLYKVTTNSINPDQASTWFNAKKVTALFTSMISFTFVDQENDVFAVDPVSGNSKLGQTQVTCTLPPSPGGNKNSQTVMNTPF